MSDNRIEAYKAEIKTIMETGCGFDDVFFRPRDVAYILDAYEAAKAQFEAMNKNFSYMSDKFQEAFSMLEAEKAKSAILINGLKAVVAAECYPSCAHPQSVWWNEWVQRPAADLLAKIEGRDECICGEINARHCPVHNEVQG